MDPDAHDNDNGGTSALELLARLALVSMVGRNQPRRDGPHAFNGWRDGVTDGAAASLADTGVVGLRAVLPEAVATALSEHVDAELERRKVEARMTGPADVEAKAASERWFGAVRDRRDRYDLRLAADAPAVQAALRRVGAAVAPLLEAVITLDSLVAELSCLISDPGAIRQSWHPDSLLPSQCATPLFTCFVALQTIEPVRGSDPNAVPFGRPAITELTATHTPLPSSGHGADARAAGDTHGGVARAAA